MAKKLVFKKIRELSNWHLLELYEEYVRRDHYDPTTTFKYLDELPYSKDQLKDEIEFRMYKEDPQDK